MNSTPDADSSAQASEAPGTPGTSSSDVVCISSTFDAHGVSTATAALTPDSDKRRKEIHCDPRSPIPVIFLPGVMGTLLANRITGKNVWSAPNMGHVFSYMAGAASVIGGYFASATQRETRLDPTDAVVDPRGPVEVGKCGMKEDEAKRRGWNTVHRWSYQPTLAWLQETLNNPMFLGNLIGEWAKGDDEGEKAALKAVLGTHPSDYGGYGAGGPLTADSDEFKSLLRHRYEVYAIGYNWLQSNELSARQVLDGVDFIDKHTKKTTRIMGIREICRENKTDKAIIITHSMGGLVARMASQLCGGADCMYGVIHGAQPATGAPVFAKRFRTGGEDFVSKSLMGRNDAEFVALSGFAEGPLELSPMPDYNDGKPWWIFKDKAGKERMALPEHSARDAIYTKDAWYGLLPDSSILDPAGIVKKRLDNQPIPMSVHQHFKDTMKVVVERQKKLINNYHPNTYAMYGDGALELKPADGTQPPPKLEASLRQKDLETYGTVVWQGDIPESVKKEDLKAAKLIAKDGDNHHGVLKILVGGQMVTLTVQQQPVAPEQGKYNGIIHGDGTVPRWSAEAQGRGVIPGVSTAIGTANGVQMVFVQGGYVHQFCFTHPWTRWATLYSVAQVAHSIPVKAP